MSKHLFERRLFHFLKQAELQGLSSPIISVFEPRAKRPREIYAKVHGRQLRLHQRASHREPLPEGIYSLTEAPSWLRLHAGIGGSAVANLLKTATARPDYWLIAFMPKHLAIAGIDETGVHVEASTYYDGIALRLCSKCAAKFRGRDALPLFAENGRIVRVQGANLKEAERALRLIEVVHQRGLPCLNPGDQSVNLPVDDDLLAIILHVLYGASPAAVAETVRALRKLDDEDGVAWLLRVLRCRPELRSLSDRVKEELRR